MWRQPAQWRSGNWETDKCFVIYKETIKTGCRLPRQPSSCLHNACQYCVSICEFYVCFFLHFASVIRYNFHGYGGEEIEKIESIIMCSLLCVFPFPCQCSGSGKHPGGLSARVAVYTFCRAFALYRFDAACKGRMVGESSASCGSSLDTGYGNTLFHCIWNRRDSQNSA